MTEIQEGEEENQIEEVQIDVQKWKEINNQIYQVISGKTQNQAKLMKQLKQAQDQIESNQNVIKDLQEKMNQLLNKRQRAKIQNIQLQENNMNLQLFTEFQNEIIAMKNMEDEAYDSSSPILSEVASPIFTLLRKNNAFELCSPSKIPKKWSFSTMHKQSRIILENNNKRASFPPDEALCLLDKPIRPFDVVTINFKMVDGFGFDIGICSLQTNLSVLLRDIGLCFYNGGNPAFLYDKSKVHQRYGQESSQQGQISMHIDALQGSIQYTVNGVNYGDAFTGIDFVNNIYFPAVSSQYNRIIEITDFKNQDPLTTKA